MAAWAGSASGTPSGQQTPKREVPPVVSRAVTALSDRLIGEPTGGLGATGGSMPEDLDRRFEAIVFDWEGTAVPDRRADAADLKTIVEALSLVGVDLVIVSGTNVDNVDGQLCARPAGPGELHLCLNRGSEVFSVDRGGVHLVQRRTRLA